jgi:hypothetical protein
VNWVIDVLLQRHLKLHMLYNYKYNIHKNIFEFVTEKKICDGKDIVVYNNNNQHKSNTLLTLLKIIPDAN